MPSPRRQRLLLLATLATLVGLLFYSSSLKSDTADARAVHGFYRKTMDGINRAKPAQVVVGGPKDDGAGGAADDDKRATAGTKQRLQAAEQQAKDKANEKALRPDPPSRVVGVGNAADGQPKKPTADASDQPAREPKEQRDAQRELDSILDKAPVVIFSKTYCPHSKRAKDILLNKYDIKPAPVVIELDEHPLGKALQNRLGATTSRTTVPNVMVNGKSIGGADEIVALDDKGHLMDTLRGESNKPANGRADQVVMTLRDAGSRRIDVSERPAART